jgi:hypothetical protein
MNRRDEKCVQSSGQKTLKGKHGLEGVDGRIVSKWILKKYYQCVEWSHLAQYRDQWEAAAKPSDSIKGRYFLTH